MNSIMCINLQCLLHLLIAGLYFLDIFSHYVIFIKSTFCFSTSELCYGSYLIVLVYACNKRSEAASKIENSERDNEN